MPWLRKTHQQMIRERRGGLTPKPHLRMSYSDPHWRAIRRAGEESGPVFVVLCGPSHAGKTTFARKLGDSFRIINSDEIRKQPSGRFGSDNHEREVWAAFDSLKCKALNEGRNVVLDACHISEKARWHALQGPNGRHRKIFIVFDLPLEIIRARCLTTQRVCWSEVEGMWEAFQKSKPTLTELKLQGFGEIYAHCSGCGD